MAHCFYPLRSAINSRRVKTAVRHQKWTASGARQTTRQTTRQSDDETVRQTTRQTTRQSRASASSPSKTFILQASPNLHPFVLEGLVRTMTFFTLLLGVAYSVSKSESLSSSEVRNYDHHRWEPNKYMRETNTPCVPFDVFLFYHWERCEKVDHVRHRGLKECVANRFSTNPYFAGLFADTAGPLQRRK